MTHPAPRPAGSPGPRRRRSPRRSALVAACALVLAATACNDDGREMREPGPDQTLSIITTTAAPSTLTPSTVSPDSGAPGDGMGHDADTVTVPGFDVALPWPDGDRLPRRHTCRGAGVSPTVSWAGLPPGTVEVALVVRTPDTSAPVLWVVAGLSPDLITVREGARLGSAVVGLNDTGELGWTPPCPDPDSSLLVRVEVHALAQQVELQRGDPADVMLPAIEAATIATAVGTGIAVG